MVIFWPTLMTFGFLICGFAARMALTVVSCFAATAPSVSPDLMT
jgi:hypothetical protein